MLQLIVAYTKNRVIGLNNDMPWYLPADLKHFKDITTDSSVIMGRNTYDSIVARLGHGLPNRQNIVLTRDTSQTAEDAVFVSSLSKALEKASHDAVFIIGGAQVFKESLPKVDRIYATEIDVELEGDTFFSELPANEWREVASESHQADDKNQYGYRFVTYEKI